MHNAQINKIKLYNIGIMYIYEDIRAIFPKENHKRCDNKKEINWVLCVCEIYCKTALQLYTYIKRLYTISTSKKQKILHFKSHRHNNLLCLDTVNPLSPSPSLSVFFSLKRARVQCFKGKVCARMCVYTREVK